MVYCNFWILIGTCKQEMVYLAHIPRTTNMLVVYVFFATMVVDFEVFLWVFLINVKQLFHLRLLDMR